MVRLTAAVAATAALLCAQPAQTPDASAVFEVASIKPSTSSSVRGWEGGPGSNDATRYKFGVASLLDLIDTAYNVGRFQISSKISLDEPRFDVDARISPGATKEQFRAMLQNLLAERFHLKVHIESRDFPAYELTVAKSGQKLSDPSSQPKPDGFPVLPPNRPGMTSTMSNSGDGVMVHLRAQQQTIAALARFVQPPGGEPIVDKTGLTGKYDFLLEYTYEPPGAAATNLPVAGADLFHALEQQLGLKLVSKKLPFDVIVIDAVDKQPTSN